MPHREVIPLTTLEKVLSKNAFLERNTIAYIDYKYIGYAFKNRRAVPQVLAW